MATNTALVASIVANPSAHFVDKIHKMDRTIDKMCSNHASKIEQGMTGNMQTIDSAELRGYGKGKNQGD